MAAFNLRVIAAGDRAMYYLKLSKCSSFLTWLFFCKRQFGGTALHLRVFGWDMHFGYKE